MKRLLKFTWPILIVLVAVAGYTYDRMRPVPVETAAVQRGRIEEVVEEEAVTQLHTERVISPDFAGAARRIELEVGDPVRQGQLITTVEDEDLKIYADMIRASIDEVRARLDGVDVTLPKPSEISAAQKEAENTRGQVAALEQEVKAAEADLEFAQKDYARLSGLEAGGSASVREFQRATRNRDVARAALGAVRSRLSAAGSAAGAAELSVKVLQESLQDTAHLRKVFGAQIEQFNKETALIDRQLAKTRITCPIDGVVLEKYIDSAQHVQQGTPLLKVGAPESIEIRADILSDKIGRVREGQVVHLIGPAIGDGSAAGRVKQVYPSGFTKISSLGVRQQRVTVLIEFDNAELRLKPGAELDVQIVVATRDDALLVPGAAVIATAKGPAVFAAADGRAVLRPIVIGLRGKQSYEITEGLAEGDTVIVRPPTDLEEGRALTVRQE